MANALSWFYIGEVLQVLVQKRGPILTFQASRFSTGGCLEVSTRCRGGCHHRCQACYTVEFRSCKNRIREMLSGYWTIKAGPLVAEELAACLFEHTLILTRARSQSEARVVGV